MWMGFWRQREMTRHCSAPQSVNAPQVYVVRHKSDAIKCAINIFCCYTAHTHTHSLSLSLSLPCRSEARGLIYKISYDNLTIILR